MKRKPHRRHTTKRGRSLENAIHILRPYGFVLFRGKHGLPKYLKTHSAPPLRYIITDYPYPTLYGTPGKKEAFIHSEIGEFILEAKSQDGSGSCDEKPAHMWECFLVSPYHWIAFFDGPWFGRTERGLRVVDWLRTRIGAHPVQGRAFYVTNGYDEFVALLNRLFQHNAREQNRDARSVDLLSLAGDPSA